jgi:hypothetical protein
LKLLSVEIESASAMRARKPYIAYAVAVEAQGGLQAGRAPIVVVRAVSHQFPM